VHTHLQWNDFVATLQSYIFPGRGFVLVSSVLEGDITDRKHDAWRAKEVCIQLNEVASVLVYNTCLFRFCGKNAFKKV